MKPHKRNPRQHKDILFYALTFLLMSVFIFYFSFGVEAKKMNWADRFDEESGLDWESLLKGDIPDDEYWKFILPQIDYLKETFGPEVSSTYDLYQKGLLRTAMKGFVNQDPRVIEIKTIERWPDPVIIHGRELPRWAGKKTDNLRLYAYHLGKFIPIPYQFDEFTPKGIKVMPDGGPESNPQDGDGLYSPQDEFMFMAHDLGDRVKVADCLSGYKDVLEITVSDPLTKKRGWCYLIEFENKPPARSPLNYATYIEKYNQFLGFYIFSQTSYKIIGGKLYKQVFPQTSRVPVHAGGNFEDFTDRVKFRVRIRLFFGTIKINITEDQLTGDTLAVRDGPVRCTRRCWSKIIIRGIELPKVASIIADITLYDSSFLNPVNLYVPINPGLLWTDFTLYSGTDLNENAEGSYWYNSNNPEGFLVNGRMTREEKSMNESIDKWRLVTGQWGTMMNRSVWDPKFQEQADIRIRYTDDSKGDPPDYDPGHYGMAYSYSTLDSIKPGLYPTELDWFFPPWFNDKDNVGKLNMDMVNAYLDMYDNPVSIIADGRKFINKPRPKGKHIDIDKN